MTATVYQPLSQVRGNLRVAWYRTPVATAALRRLMRRSDLHGWLQAGGHLLLYLATGALAFRLWADRWWLAFAAALFAHGTVASFMRGVAPHELAHGTVFRTKWLNRVFLYVYSELSWWDPFDYGASHTYHHRYTLYPEGDMPEPRTLPGAWREMRAVWKRQRTDPGYQFDTPVPGGPPAVADGRADGPDGRDDADDPAASLGDLAPQGLREDRSRRHPPAARPAAT